MDNTVTINRRLRPLRLAFLAQPNDRETLRKIFEINTCLWGGQYNAIIPMFERTPPWWHDGQIGRRNAQEIFEGYKRAFEPDFLVNHLIVGQADEFAVKRNRIIGLTEMYSILGNFGLSVSELFEHLYKSHFQYQLRNPIEFLLPQTADNRLDLFVSAAFGSLPAEGSLSHLREQYIHAFSAKVHEVSDESFFNIHSRQYIWPLRIGSNGLVPLKRSWQPFATLFLLDATKPRDLIDFWKVIDQAHPLNW
jgi:hypothetical protein